MKHNMKLLILGSGNIGSTIATLLSQYDDYEITIASHNEKSLKKLKKSFKKVHVAITTLLIDVSDSKLLKKEFTKVDVVVSALSYYYNIEIAKVALKAECSYFDLTEDRATTSAIKKIANDATKGQVFMPQCGLAPGFIGILAYGLSHKLTKLKSLKMRVGALPLYPTNQLKYNLSWSTDGLINEYCNPSEVILDGKKQEVMPLEGLEYFNFEGVEYETFNTSGGLGTLCDTLEGKIDELSYKTIRYKGHRFLIDFLLNDLNLKNRRAMLKEIFEAEIPMTQQDVVLVFCSVIGYKNSKFSQISYAKKLYGKTVLNQTFSAIEMTTAVGICTAIDLFKTEVLPQQGFLTQEDINLDIFLKNRFGVYYEEK
jgi:saccharopine dehydrogenase-like NADP-dependent oxidoreductase